MTNDLPAGWSLRRPALDDVPEILAVVHASDIAAVGEPDFTAEEVVEILQAPHFAPEKDSWVALDDSGGIVGWAYINNPTGSARENLDVYVDPERGRPARAPLLDLVLARIAERAREAGRASLTARAGAIPTEREYIDLLERAGFTFAKRYARMRRDLGPEDVPPQAPSGITIRGVRHGPNGEIDDAEMRTFHRILDTSFRDTADHNPSDYATYRARLAALPGIAWDEWFVAEVDGEPAGILQSSYEDGDPNEGWIKNLAVDRRFRGRGVAKLLLRTAFATYRAKGRTMAGLAVDTANPTGAYRLYESVGMAPLYEADMYERSVSA